MAIQKGLTRRQECQHLIIAFFASDINPKDKNLGIFMMSACNGITFRVLIGASLSELEEDNIAIAPASFGDHVIIDYLIDVHFYDTDRSISFFGGVHRRKKNAASAIKRV
jgi:hypothetical protein